jgi:hypothetical protein
MNFKKLLTITTVCAVVAVLSMSFTTGNEEVEVVVVTEEVTTNAAAVGDVSIYFENHCGKDVAWEIKYLGLGSSSTIGADEIEEKTVQTGGKTYIDGDFLMEVERSYDGTTILMCG